MTARADGSTTARRASNRRRAGKAAKRLIRADKVAAARRSWKQLLLAYMAMWVMLLAFVVLVPQPAFSRGLAVGVGLGSTPILWREFLIGRGIATREMGAIAEEWTAAELAKLDAGRWFVLHDLPGPFGNIDHVAIGPNRIHVVETKWTSATPTPQYLRDAARQAQSNAGTIRTHLAAQGVVDRDVRPLLIVWGPAAADRASTPERIDDTTVVLGTHAKQWRERMQETDQGTADRVALEAVASPLPTPNGGWTANSAPAPTAPRGVENDARDITVVEWKRYGKHRLYANASGHEESLGWIDVPSGHLQLVDATAVDAARELRRERDRLHGSDGQAGDGQGRQAAEA